MARVLSLHERFLQALGRLVHYHVDSVAAQSYDGPAISSSKPEAKIHFSQQYPGYSQAWDAWRSAKSNEQREGVIEALHAEHRALSRRPHRLETYKDTWGKTRYRRIYDGQAQPPELRPHAAHTPPHGPHQAPAAAGKGD